LRFDDSNVHVQVRRVARIFIHPQYSFPLHDIAILQVNFSLFLEKQRRQSFIYSFSAINDSFSLNF